MSKLHKIISFSIVIIFVLLIFLGCVKNQNNTNKIIKIDIKSEYNGKLPKLKIQSVVPLETKESSLIGHVASIEAYSNYIYILDIFSGKSVMAFSRDGKFVGKTKLGKGPGEIINPFAIFVDKENKNVLVWDQSLNLLCKYDLFLNPISREKINIPIIDFAKLDNDKILVYNHYLEDYTFHLYSLNTKAITKKYIKDLKYSGVVSLFRSICVNNRILMVSPYDYNIYQFKNHKIHSEYFLDFNKFSISQEDIERSSISNVQKLIAVGRKVSSPYEIAESDNFLLFHVYFKNNPIYFIHPLGGNETLPLNAYFKNYILPKCQIRGVLENDIFYAIVDPKDMIEYQEKSGNILVDSEINVQQNPFFMTFQLENE